MSDEKQNPAETEEATPEEVVKTESTDLPDDAVGVRLEEPDHDQSTQDTVAVAGVWKIVSLHNFYLQLGGSSIWNYWRKFAGEKIRLDDSGKEHVLHLSSLRGFNLSGMDLSGYELKGKDLVEADFTGSLLKGTIFTGSDLRRAKFNGADLSDADFSDTRLSGAVLDEETRFEAIKSNSQVTVGINGIYVRRTSWKMGEESESAALMTLIPAGDSMKGHSSEAVLENLKHARQLNTTSILLVSIVTTILVFQEAKGKPEDNGIVKLPVLELMLPIGTLSILAQIIALVYQFLVLSHIREAADGAKYLQTREDAMKVGSFPWGISNYSGKKPGIDWNAREFFRTFNAWWTWFSNEMKVGSFPWGISNYPGKKPDFAGNAREIFRSFNGWWPWFSNELNRAATAFHPILFLVGGGFYFYQHRERYGSISPLLFKPAIFLLLIVFLFVFSSLVYRESCRFRRPIVFDAEAEKAPRSDLASLAESVAEQLKVTKRLASFIETAVPRYANRGDRLSDRLPGGAEIAMRRIPAGYFEMGSDESGEKNEKPSHKVGLREFWMAEHTVTQQLWEAVMGSRPDQLNESGFINPRYPVIFVSWEDAVRFCQTLNDVLGLTEQYGYRLPTEAEWEYAARAGTTTDYGFKGAAAELGEYAWYRDNSEGHPQVVCQKLPNGFGLYDMHGNVWEWCQDHYQDNYQGAPVDGSAWKDGDKAAPRVFRGGSWAADATSCHSARRRWSTLGKAFYDLGFRLSRTLPSALLPSGRE
jgi:formylglycine-generating enzyme required for sulfatase activity